MSAKPYPSYIEPTETELLEANRLLSTWDEVRGVGAFSPLGVRDQFLKDRGITDRKLRQVITWRTVGRWFA
jgi:hypothetical protein